MINIPTLKDECSEFINSAIPPLHMSLMDEGYGFRKIKMRTKKNITECYKLINQNFIWFDHLLSRSCICLRDETLKSATHSDFYIYPINGFKMLTSNSILAKDNIYNVLNQNGISEKTTSDVLMEDLDCVNIHASAVSLKKYNVIYNIKYFYAVRKELIDFIK